ncbi:hypothetical protein NPS58_17545 [Pseudomonas putida]|jgi:hypothetical protein|uniref:hypothetical protein n=1 Tax=Pseudomonas putida TaxID=303 RepID=UPI002363B4B3|nr:hypothetical protein [Pseudomonas putida]MDD2059227.1 hypothetical protein [Pseudomonas putida]
MTSARLKMSQEGLLWKTALSHLGPTELHQFVVGLWVEAGPSARATVEYLDAEHVGDEVLSILRDVQTHVGAVVPYRPVESDRIAIYSAHAEHLADKLLQAMPVGKLPPSLKGVRLEIDLGM